MTARKEVEAEVFDLNAIGEADEPSFVFKLGTETFRCKAQGDMHWGTIERWMIAQASGEAAASAVVLEDFFAAVLYDDDVDRFMEVKADPKGPLTADRANALIRKVNEKVLGIEAADPTKQPSSSRAGSPRTGSTSRASSAGKRGKTSAA